MDLIIKKDLERALDSDGQSILVVQIYIIRVDYHCL